MFNDYVQHVGNSLFFMYQEPFNRDWDNRLNLLMNVGVVISADRYCVTFSLHGQNYDVWVGNRWHSYGHLYAVDNQCVQKHLQCRPRFRTMRRLNKLHGKFIMGAIA